MRPRKRDRHLPACVYQRRGAYYLVQRGRWIPLGRDLAAALAEYARHRRPEPTGAMQRLISDALEARRPLILRDSARLASNTIPRAGVISLPLTLDRFRRVLDAKTA